MDDCIFCKIASSEIQGLRIYEDKETLAFMDIAKDVDGHILVIPKKHCKNILDCDLFLSVILYYFFLKFHLLIIQELFFLYSMLL